MDERKTKNKKSQFKNNTIIFSLKYNFSGGFKLELVTTFHIRFCYDSYKSIAKNIVNVTFFVEKYNC